MTSADKLDPGPFSTWLREMEAALDGETDADVSCDGCTACCTSLQFVHVGPDETETLARIPTALLFPAPGLPDGHVVLGYDERGHCPMLVDDACSIYEHRPRTCRTYDCRVFPATGVPLDDDDKTAIAERVVRWSFSYPSAVDAVENDAVRAAAAWLTDEGTEPNATRRAVLAIELHRSFLGVDEQGAPTVVPPDPDEVRVQLSRRARL